MIALYWGILMVLDRFERFERADLCSRGPCRVTAYGDHMAEVARATAVATATIRRTGFSKKLWAKP